MRGPTVIPDVYVIVRRGDEVLLLLRTATGYKDGEWGPPSGKVELGETYAAAAVRELEEEVGLRMREDELRFMHVIERTCADDPTPWVGLFFEVESAERPTNREPHKHTALEWFRVSELPSSTVQYVEHVLGEVGRGVSYSHWHE